MKELLTPISTEDYNIRVGYKALHPLISEPLQPIKKVHLQCL